jgi:deoxyhypusine synthase
MAIMLHEIGHNFYKPSPLRKAASLSMDVISNGVKDALAGEAVFAFVELANEHVPDVVKDVIKTVGTQPNMIFPGVS